MAPRLPSCVPTRPLTNEGRAERHLSKEGKFLSSTRSVLILSDEAAAGKYDEFGFRLRSPEKRAGRLDSRWQHLAFGDVAERKEKLKAVEERLYPATVHTKRHPRVQSEAVDRLHTPGGNGRVCESSLCKEEVCLWVGVGVRVGEKRFGEMLGAFLYKNCKRADVVRMKEASMIGILRLTVRGCYEAANTDEFEDGFSKAIEDSLAERVGREAASKQIKTLEEVTFAPAPDNAPCHTHDGPSGARRSSAASSTTAGSEREGGGEVYYCYLRFGDPKVMEKVADQFAEKKLTKLMEGHTMANCQLAIKLLMMGSPRYLGKVQNAARMEQLDALFDIPYRPDPPRAGGGGGPGGGVQFPPSPLLRPASSSGSSRGTPNPRPSTQPGSKRAFVDSLNPYTSSPSPSAAHPRPWQAPSTPSSNTGRNPPL